MRAVFVPFDLASEAQAWAVISPTEKDICGTVLSAQIIRGFDGRKDMAPEHYFVGRDTAQISLDEVFTVQAEERVSAARKSRHLSLFNEIKSPEFLALISHLVHDAIGSEDVALILPDAVGFEHPEAASFMSADLVCHRVNADLETSGHPIHSEDIKILPLGALLVFDHVLQVYDDMPDQAVPNGDICGGDVGAILKARVVTPGHEEGERTISIYDVEVLSNGVNVNLSGKPEIVGVEAANAGDEQINLIVTEVRENGEVITEDGEALNAFTGLAKNNLAQDEAQAEGDGDDDSGQTTQQSNELD